MGVPLPGNNPLFNRPYTVMSVVKPLTGYHVLPSEVEKKFLKAFRKEDSVLLSSSAGQLVHSVTGQRVHGWIDVTERELIRGNLSVWRHVSLAEE